MIAVTHHTPMATYAKGDDRSEIDAPSAV